MKKKNYDSKLIHRRGAERLQREVPSFLTRQDTLAVRMPLIHSIRTCHTQQVSECQKI